MNGTVFNKRVFHKTTKGKNSKFFYCGCKKRYSTKQKLTIHIAAYKEVSGNGSVSNNT